METKDPLQHLPDCANTLSTTETKRVPSDLHFPQLKSSHYVWSRLSGLTPPAPLNVQRLQSGKDRKLDEVCRRCDESVG